MISQERCEELWLSLSDVIDFAVKTSPTDEVLTPRVDTLHRMVLRALEEQNSKSIALEMRGSLFVYDGVPLSVTSIRGRATIEFLCTIGAGGIEYSTTVTRDDIFRLIHAAVGVIIGDPAAKKANFEVINGWMTGIFLPESLDSVTWDWIDAGPAGQAYAAAGFDFEAVDEARRESAEAVDGAMQSARDGHAVKLSVARTISEKVVNATQSSFADLLHLAERPEFDVFTVQHSLRVSFLTSYVASRMGAPKELIVELGAAAMFHDVGKGRIPESILYKRGRLDDDERRIMQSHPQLGADILLGSRDRSAASLGAAWGHHLRHDGKGYPTRRPWFETTKATSLIQICDVFEALTSRRPYKAPYSPARTYSILYSDHGAFDPGVLAAFTRAMGLYPPGRFVLLNDGRLGRVAQVTGLIDRPVLRTLPQGELIDLSIPALAHLSVVRLLDEPEFVQLLTSGLDGKERVGLAQEQQEATEQALSESRDEELEFLSITDDECEHGEECRLC